MFLIDPGVRKPVSLPYGERRRRRIVAPWLRGNRMAVACGRKLNSVPSLSIVLAGWTGWLYHRMKPGEMEEGAIASFAIS